MTRRSLILLVALAGVLPRVAGPAVGRAAGFVEGGPCKETLLFMDADPQVAAEVGRIPDRWEISVDPVTGRAQVFLKSEARRLLRVDLVTRDVETLASDLPTAAFLPASVAGFTADVLVLGTGDIVVTCPEDGSVIALRGGPR